MSLFSFHWHTTEHAQHGYITMQGVGEIDALIKARRLVRETVLQGIALENIIIEPRRYHEQQANP